MLPKFCIVVGGLLGATAVALGAMETHALKKRLEAQMCPAEQITRRLENAQTAGRYQIVHALAILAIGAAAHQRQHWLWAVAVTAMLLGSLCFSGILHLFALTGNETLLPLVPLGGGSLILAWLAISLAGFLAKESAT